MDKDVIITKCRKVYVPLQDNKIFSAGPHEREFEFVSVFKNEQSAINTAEARKRPWMWEKPEKQFVEHKVASFYLVPATLIDSN